MDMCLNFRLYMLDGSWSICLEIFRVRTHAPTFMMIWGRIILLTHPCFIRPHKISSPCVGVPRGLGHWIGKINNRNPSWTRFGMESLGYREMLFYEEGLRASNKRVGSEMGVIDREYGGNRPRIPLPVVSWTLLPES